MSQSHMDKVVSLREANQSFSRFVREVEAGSALTITRNGAPVARLVPIDAAARRLAPEQQAARARTRARTRIGWPLDLGPIERDWLHER